MTSHPAESRRLIHDERVLIPEELVSSAHARRVALEELLPVLASPDSARALTLDPSGRTLSDGVNIYPLREALPLLLPVRLQPFFTDRIAVPCRPDYDAFLQYFLLATIKQSGEINAPSGDVHFRRHLFRMKGLLDNSRGLVLDVGCDDPLLGAALLPPHARYVGLDPFCQRSQPFRLVGVGEFLPLRDGAVDAVVFNTSLDHMLDWHRALDEAERVLAPGGRLYIATLVWTARASLLTDSVHFHHFREPEIFDALSAFDVESAQRYEYKNDSHRCGLYLCARKAPAPAPIPGPSPTCVA